MALFFCSGCFNNTFEEQKYEDSSIEESQAEDIQTNNTPYRENDVDTHLEISTSYYNSTYKFWIDIPTLWEDVYEIVEEQNNTIVYCKICSDVKVKMFTIKAWTYGDFEEFLETLASDYGLDYSERFVENDVLGSNNDYVFTIIPEIALEVHIETAECREELVGLSITYAEQKSLFRLEK